MATGLNIVTLPCLEDNFAYLVHAPDTGETAVIDAPDAAPIADALDRIGWSLSHILLTHHHPDHVQGVEALRNRYGAQVIGAEADSRRLPPLDVAVGPENGFSFAGHPVTVIETPGHTVGHIVYHLPEDRILFSGDTLFALGCGRLFEGTPVQMWDSLSTLAALPDDTTVYFGHEYTIANANFALDLDPDNHALRDRISALIPHMRKGEDSTPTTIGVEKATNPFLRAGDAALKASMGMGDARDAEVFAEIRRRKDRA